VCMCRLSALACSAEMKMPSLVLHRKTRSGMVVTALKASLGTVAKLVNGLGKFWERERAKQGGAFSLLYICCAETALTAVV